jgi:hypothetical protein
MPIDEIEVPKELREFMLEGAQETMLGQKNGAKKQFRYGNLHIREYDDKFLIHTDKDALRGLGDPATRARLGAAGRERCRTRFDVGVVAVAWEAVLAEAVGGRPPDV